jgi:hypothetical protein
MKSSVELEQDLLAARQAEQEAEAEATARRRQDERRRESLAKSALTIAADLEHRIEKAPAEMVRLAGQAGRPPYDLRLAARRLQVGTLQPGTVASGEVVLDAPDIIAHRDEAAALAWGLNGVARQLMARIGGELGADHRLVVRLDIAECTSWRLFNHRLRQLAEGMD